MKKMKLAASPAGTTGQRVLQLLVGHRTGPTFSDVLGISGARILQSEDGSLEDMKKGSKPKAREGVVFEYKIPTRLCLHHSGNNSSTSTPTPAPELALSAAIALFDEFSTRGLVLEDRLYRPGVSVHLSGRLHKPALAGESVRIVTHAEKIGANLGFCSIAMESLNGHVLYSGRHIKYLPMGKAWETVMGSSLFRSALISVLDDDAGGVANKLFGRKLRSLILSKSTSKETEAEAAGPNVVAGAFSLLNINTSPSDGTFFIQPRPVLNNPMGKVHGGALALAVEHSQSEEFKANDKGSYRLQSMDLTYLSASKVFIITRPQYS
jgi:acyl-coenzyme A thioesterase PaaI-like protein